MNKSEPMGGAEGQTVEFFPAKTGDGWPLTIHPSSDASRSCIRRAHRSSRPTLHGDTPHSIHRLLPRIKSQLDDITWAANIPLFLLKRMTGFTSTALPPCLFRALWGQNQKVTRTNSS